MYEFKIPEDKDVIKVALLISLLTISYKPDKMFYTLIINAVGLERWDKFLDYIESLLVQAQKLEQSKKELKLSDLMRGN